MFLHWGCAPHSAFGPKAKVESGEAAALGVVLMARQSPAAHQAAKPKRSGKDFFVQSRPRLLCIEREPGVLPRIEPAVKWMHILPTAIGEFLCHTGTRSLVRSSAVSDDGAIVRNLVQVLIDLVSGHPDRARQFLI